jgi:hypothetical protein
MEDLIAERTFDLKREGRTDTSIRVGLGKPYLCEDDSETWACNLYIERPERTLTHPIYGIDSLQALALASMLLKVELASLQAEFGHQITFLDEENLWLSAASA